MNGANAPAVSANTTNPANAAYSNPNDPSSWTFTPSRQRIDQVDEIVTNQTSFNSSFDSGSINHALTGGLELIERTAQVADVRHGSGHHRWCQLSADLEPGDELL